MRQVLVQKDSYFDSVMLMQISQEVRKTPGVTEGVVAMGTDMNKRLLLDIGFLDAELERASANDLLIAVEAAEEETIGQAVTAAMALLQGRTERDLQAEEYRPVSLDAAVRLFPDANLALISVPGAYAAREARRALEKGLHVMLFSDNVSLEEEVQLKRLAARKGLLMMGPDCGTTIINGKPICFANVVRRGPIGVVGASGTGIQEVTCSIDRLGSGISQAIGTGGRDLKDERIGGAMMCLGIDALSRDEQTQVIVVISKPPLQEIARKVLLRLKESGKPAVVHFIGLARERPRDGNLFFADSLEESALYAVALARQEAPTPLELDPEETRSLVTRETVRMSADQRYLRGLFSGGTLADEALILLERGGVPVFSNVQTDPQKLLADPRISRKHTIVDLGDDVFTVGRPHPMIDPTLRSERILQEALDPQLALLLLDIVLGYGSHPDPAGALTAALSQAKEKAAERGGYLPVVASIVGTPGDYQILEKQRQGLQDIGCVVMPSNLRAASFALQVLKELAHE